MTGRADAVTQELRAAGNLVNGRLHWVVGGNFEHDSTHEIQDNLSVGDSASQAFVELGYPIINETLNRGDSRYTSKAVFGNVDFDILPTIIAHAGARYTSEHTGFDGCLESGGNNVLGEALSTLFDVDPPIGVGQCATFNPDNSYAGLVHRSLSQDNVSWRFGLDWKPRPGALIYANVSRGYKSGGFPTLASTSSVQFTPVSQEKLTSYEAGFKLSMFDRKLQLNGAGFYYDYADKQVKSHIVVPLFGALEDLANIPKSRIVGAELQATAMPIPGLTVNAGGTLLKSKVLGSPLFTLYTGQQQDIGGTSFPYTPEWQFNSDVEYDWRLSSRLNAFVGGSVTYRSATSSDFVPSPALAIDAYTLLDLRVGIHAPDDRWRLTLSGHNVTDKYYWTDALRNIDALVRYAGMPATYTISFSYRFR